MVGGIAALAGLKVSGAAAQRRTLRARPADSFVDFLGVNTHLWDRDQIYVPRYETVKQRLIELGVRYLRDAGAGNYPGYRDRVLDLRRLGFRFNFTVDPRAPAHGVAGGVAFVRSVGDAAISIEGPNEYDTSGDPEWRRTIVAFQRELHAAVRREIGSDLPVVAPSFAKDEPYSLLGDMRAIADRSNLHHYFSGRNPGTPGWGSTGPLGRYGSMPWAMSKARLQGPGRPVVVTETGYPNALKSTDGHRPTPEAIAGRYLPRLCLEFFDAGVERLYIYEFLSSRGDANYDIEASFGLLRNDPASTPKPAFHALRNLIKLLSEPDAVPFVPASLEPSIAGSTDDLRTILFQKSTGSFYLATWLEVPAWEPDAQRVIPIRARQLHIVLSEPKPTMRLAVHTLEENGSMSTTPYVTKMPTFPLSVTDRVTVVEINP